MRASEPGAYAKVIMLPKEAGQPSSAPTKHYSTVAQAIRHVMERLPAEQRANAVIQTPGRLLFFPEIEAVFEVTRARGEPRVAKA